MTEIRQTSATSENPAPSAKNPAVSDKPPSLADELLQLNDDFAEFSEIGAFMCHAFAISLHDHESLNKDVISGARRCSNWLQFRSEEMRERIRHVHARYAAENT